MTDVTKMTDAALSGSIIESRKILKLAKSNLATLENELSDRQCETAAKLMQAANKEDGSLTFEHGGMKFKAEAKKTVTWDSGKLQAVAATMEWTTVERLFDIKFSVRELVYKAISDESLHDKLTAARTTKTADMKVSLVDGGA